MIWLCKYSYSECGNLAAKIPSPDPQDYLLQKRDEPCSIKLLVLDVKVQNVRFKFIACP
jgi:hypothetical protein